MLNVGNGDAIIVYLFDESRNFVCVIDAGHKRDARAMIEALNPYLTRAGKNAPDLVICTHYDADHIGGMLPIMEHYVNLGHEVGEVWIHAPNQALSESIKVLYRNLGETKHIGLGNDLKILNENEEILKARDAKIVMESHQQMVELVDYLNTHGIKWSEPFAGISRITDLPEVEVLGPTQDFYNTLFPSWRSVKNILTEELDAIYESNAIRPRYVGDPCTYLDETPKDQVTSTNLASVILLIQTDQGKFLFTGDAGLESFRFAKDPDKMDNIFWLKIPHHGSHNNMSTALIEKMNPQFAFVSGASHVDMEVVDCFRNHACNVSVTAEESADLHWPVPA